MRPNAIGRPGRMAIFQNSTSPSFAMSSLDEVGFADRHAAGGDDRVGELGGACLNALSSSFGSSRTTPRSIELDAEAREHAVQRVAVGVVDLAFLERRADRGELVAGGEERDAQPALHLDFADAERGDQAELGRADQLSGRSTATPTFRSSPA